MADLEINAAFDSNFDDAYHKFFLINDKIFAVDRKTNLKVGKDAIFKAYAKFKSSYRGDTRTIHREIVNKIFEKFCVFIFQTNNNKDDSWLTRNAVIFNFGEGFKDIKGVKLMVTGIYRKACRLRDSANEAIEEQCGGLKGDDKEDMKLQIEESYPELYYPDAYLLRLYELLSISIESPTYKKKLESRITFFRKELGLEETKPKTGLNNMLNMVSGLMNNMGIKLPDGMELPDESKIMSTVNNMMNNEGTQNMIGNFFKEMQGCNSIKDVLSTVTDKMNDPELNETLNQCLGDVIPKHQPIEDPQESVEEETIQESVEEETIQESAEEEEE